MIYVVDTVYRFNSWSEKVANAGNDCVGVHLGGVDVCKTNSQPIARLLKVDQRLLKVDQRMHLQQWTSSVCLRLFARSPSCAVAMIPGCRLTD